MTELLSYHNDPAVKEKYVARFAQHRAADEVIQGTGFDNGRGCFVGCTLDDYRHERFPHELGWPVWLARLADGIFEGLSPEEAPQFGTDLLSAVPVGVDLEPVKHKLTIKRMDRLIVLQGKNAEYDTKDVTKDVIAVLQLVRQCAEAELGKDHCDWSEAWSEAWSAAWSAEPAKSAAWAAESAAWAAAESAECSAECSAKSAAAAESAECSAECSAKSAAAAEAAEAAAYRTERDDLLEILRSLS